MSEETDIPTIDLANGCTPAVAKTIIAFLKEKGVKSEAGYRVTWTYEDFVYIEHDDGKVQLNQLRWKNAILHSE